jgi:translation initiation factor IF-2
MQTVNSLAERLDMTAEDAVEKLRYMLFEVDGADTPITDEQVDLLIDVDEDPDIAEKVREKKLKEIEKKEKRTKRLQDAAKKAAADRRAAKKLEDEAEKEKEKIRAAQAEAGIESPPEEVVAVLPQAEEEAATFAEILPEEPELAGLAKHTQAQADAVASPTLADEALQREREEAEKEKESIIIGSAMEHTDRSIDFVRADGTRVDLPEVEVPAKESAEPVEEEEEKKGVLAEAEKLQEQEERRAKKPRPLPKPDAAVVAEVIKRAQERQARGGRPPSPAGGGAAKPRRGVTGKTARKKAKKAERARAEDDLRRSAAAAVREYQAGGLPGQAPKKRRRRRRDEDSGAEIEETVTIEIEDTISVEDLAEKMEMGVSDLILDLMDLNILATKNQLLTLDIVKQVAEPHGIIVESAIPEEADLLVEEPDAPEDLKPRAPVITVMGHVDHGKTSFLDYVRRANVAEGEVGGITQHIAAYDVETRNGRVVFLDTPGHEAFTQMRARGAQATDVVVLVVAADDGVMPQTIEAIDHARAAEVPIVVAVNKCDKANAEPDRLRQELTRFELVDEAWGGKTIMRNISAKTGDGIDELMEMLVLEAEMLELKANPNRDARGVVIESEISRGQGPVAWVLIQKGTLRPGDVFLCGRTHGRVRNMINSRGEQVQEVGPSTPVCVTGFDAPPDAGDTFVIVKDERAARMLAEKRITHEKQKQGGAAKHITLEDFHERLKAGEKRNLNIVLKADVQGSMDVMNTTLSKIGNDEVRVEIVHSGVGGINESDVLLASASDAVIIGFHVTANARVQKMAEQEGVDIRTYRIIYEAMDAVRRALEGLLKPEEKEVITGHAQVRQVFRSSSLGNIAGCYITDGEVERSSRVRVLRDDVIVYAGSLGSLRRGRDDVRLAATGFECGIKLANYEDIKEGDVIEAFRVDEVAKKLT